ncbi:phosphoribosyltransferase [Pseudoduganella namucuonensis]|uniref:Predicted phosphoribosyltransferase n=1 Tax=Pseudoduganella namucuonensis TaxID=1035707 RepID=A0A1I7JGR6_9BURK|nr:phosphoribosyltransferase family protein [Pseudoduganella namucuonensis]SFU84348.1 Predicted phosphoribosyltransferase [Pseudoduganella namucuonensis]
MSAFVLFHDRIDAGRQLASAISQRRQALRLRRPLVLAIPRGAIPIAAIVAEALQAELDVALVHKLGAPFNQEFAIGAIDEHGNRQLSPDADPESAWLAVESAQQLAVLRRRRETFGAGRPPADPAGRSVIVVDDGLATGATMCVALSAVRAGLPLELIAAAPVASQEAVQRVAALADHVVCLHAPDYFHAVGQFYEHFPQVEEDEAIATLRRFAVQTAIPQNH